MKLSPVIRHRYFDADGNPLAGGKLYTYIAGTTTPQDTYADSTGNTSNANPLILDANGEGNIWLDPTQAYKFILKDSNDVTQWTQDQVTSFGTIQSDDIEDGAVTRDKLATGAIAKMRVASKTTTYTATLDDDLIIVSGAAGSWSLALPTAVGCSGKQFIIKRTDNTLANVVTIDPDSSETIEGDSTRGLYTQNESYTIASNGTNWIVLDHKTATPLTSFSSTFSGFGTPTSQNLFWSRDKDMMELQGSFAAGTTTAAEARVGLPVTIDSTKVPVRRIVGTSIYHATSGQHYGLAATGGNTYLTYAGLMSTLNPGTDQLGNAVASAGVTLSVFARIPIANWKE